MAEEEREGDGHSVQYTVFSRQQEVGSRQQTAASSNHRWSFGVDINALIAFSCSSLRSVMGAIKSDEQAQFGQH